MKMNKIPGDVKDLSDTEEYSKARNIVFDKEHDGGGDTEQPADNEASHIADEPGFDGAFAEF